MVDKKMTFEEIKNAKDEFLKCYDILEDYQKYEKLGGSWEDLMNIGEEYESKIISEEYFNIIQKYLHIVMQFDRVHSCRYRLKKTDSLLKKIVVKTVEKGVLINKDNYLTKITDLLGIRILYIFKEDCYFVHNQIMGAFESQLAENPCIKLRSGDDEESYSQIKRQGANVEENNMYRSVHYTLYSNKENVSEAKIEIQTRTIFEEGWSEINHKLVYKNVADKYEVLKNASDVLSGLVGNCDKIGTMMKDMYDEYINKEDATPKATTKEDAEKIRAKSVSEVFSIFLNSN